MNKSLFLKIPVAIVLVVLLMQISGACHEPSIEPGKVQGWEGRPEPTFQEVAEKIAIPRFEETVGTVSAVTEVKLASEVGGRILEMKVQEGQPVSQGMVIARLDDRSTVARIAEAQSGLASAEAAAELALSQVERMRRLFDKEVATQVQWEAAEAQWRQAEAAVKAAREGVRQTELLQEFSLVVAPMDGVIQKRLADPGDLAGPGQVLAVLFGEENLQLEAGVREALAGQWDVGAEMPVFFPSLDVSVPAVVREKQSAADAQTRTTTFKLGLPALEGLQVGMYGKLQLPLPEDLRITVPKDAVRIIGQLDTLLVRDHQNRWVRRHVRIGSSHAGRLEILSGLQAGETFGWGSSAEQN